MSNTGALFKVWIIAIVELLLSMKIITIILSFMGLVLAFYLLYIGKAIIIPLIIAVIIWYILIALAEGYEKIRLGSKNVPYWLALILSFATFALAAWIFVGFVNNSVNEVIASAPKFQAKFQFFINDLNTRFDLQDRITYGEFLDYINLTTVATTAAGIITTVAGFATMISIYVLFLFLEYRTFNWKIKTLFPNPKTRLATENLIKKIQQDINTYLKIKTLISFVTAFSCYAVLMAMGIQFASFWAVLVFVLNFIPNVGSLVAVFLPVLFTVVQYDVAHAFLLAVLLTTIQMTLGSIIEPRLMGKSLNLSPLVIIISLVVWGSIWGVVGMFLCVPIMVIINIILAKFDSTRPIAVLLSSTGDVSAD